MSSGVNKVILVGFLGKDPEVRFSQSGSCFCHLSVGVNERRKDGDGWKEHCEWVRVVLIGKAGEAAGNHLRKGRQVYIEGSMRTRSYKDKEGIEKWQTEVVAFECQWLGPNPDGKGEGKHSTSNSSGWQKSGDSGKQRGNELSAGKGPPDRGDDGGGYVASAGSDGFIDDDLPF